MRRSTIRITEEETGWSTEYRERKYRRQKKSNRLRSCVFGDGCSNKCSRQAWVDLLKNYFYSNIKSGAKQLQHSSRKIGYLFVNYLESTVLVRLISAYQRVQIERKRERDLFWRLLWASQFFSATSHVDAHMTRDCYDCYSNQLSIVFPLTTLFLYCLPLVRCDKPRHSIWL